jgi:hypothetical protein
MIGSIAMFELSQGLAGLVCVETGRDVCVFEG